MIEQALRPVHRTKFDSLSKSELVVLLQESEDRCQKFEDLLQKSEGMNRNLQKIVESLKKEVKSSNKVVENLSAFLREKGYHNILLKNKLFG